ncbi:hypothetical protein LEP1GSC133_0649 [Leptospira borgpetersenii serovar Pomona str. 200901868]|nr:hypothetical protein LEP1GSC133_0649 [Leptospira borgpetersenii serovar Pomona str. 200901868]
MGENGPYVIVPITKNENGTPLSFEKIRSTPLSLKREVLRKKTHMVN